MFEPKHNGKQTGAQAGKRAVRGAAIAIALVVVGVFVSLAWRENAAKVVGAASAAKTERVLIAIEGMSCTSCASGIKAMLKRTPGVISAEVSYERREAIVDYDADKTSREKIVEAVTKLGYKDTVKS